MAEKETLLNRFIEEKFRSYPEPTRKKIPKGQLIGFSAKKYLATLLCLKKVSLKRMAEEIGVSYGLLRLWRTEKEFKALIENHVDEFTGRILERVEERAGKQIELINSYQAEPFKELATTSPPFLGFSEFRDAGYYSNALIMNIANTMEERLLQKYSDSKESLSEMAGEQIPFWSYFRQVQETLKLMFVQMSPPGRREEALRRFSRQETDLWQDKYEKLVLSAVRQALCFGKLDKKERKLLIKAIDDVQGRYKVIEG